MNIMTARPYFKSLLLLAVSLVRTEATFSCASGDCETQAFNTHEGDYTL